MSLAKRRLKRPFGRNPNFLILATDRDSIFFWSRNAVVVENRK
jgi:hypothetical protein